MAENMFAPSQPSVMEMITQQQMAFTQRGGQPGGQHIRVNNVDFSSPVGMPTIQSSTIVMSGSAVSGRSSF